MGRIKNLMLEYDPHLLIGEHPPLGHMLRAVQRCEGLLRRPMPPNYALTDEQMDAQDNDERRRGNGQA